jgi:hypothetical protein
VMILRKMTKDQMDDGRTLEWTVRYDMQVR